jgi:hypothetical protein
MGFVILDVRYLAARYSREVFGGGDGDFLGGSGWGGEYCDGEDVWGDSEGWGDAVEERKEVVDRVRMEG